MTSYYVQDYYYYADNYNYTDYYLEKYELNKQVSLFAGIGYILFAGITLTLYSRLLTVIVAIDE